MRQKFWMVYSVVNNGKLDRFDNYQDAEDEARRKAVSGDTYCFGTSCFCQAACTGLAR